MTTIPARFAYRITRHVLSASTLSYYPLILGVQGRPGVGKSYQVRSYLRDQGYSLIVESGSALSGQFEGEPIAAMRELLNRCKETSAIRGSHAVILLEDFDLSPAGQSDETRYTVNSQLLSGFLMNLADDPQGMSLPSGYRVPIIMTGNDFTRLSGPLTRRSRTDIFSWEPTDDELAVMAIASFKDVGLHLEDAEVRKILRIFPDITIAEVSNAASEVRADGMISQVGGFERATLADARNYFRSPTRSSLDEIVNVIKEHRDAMSKPRNFLPRRMRSLK